MRIPFNSSHVFGEEGIFVQKVIETGEIAGNGKYTRLCHEFFQKQFKFKHCLLTNSCTASLEMAAILLDIQPGDEVIVPSYGYVSTVNAFVLRGATLVFMDSLDNSPHQDVSLLPDLITPRTKAIVVMHYGGVAVDMDFVMNFANNNDVFVVEDAAHGIDAYYKKRPLGSIGHLGVLSFHSSKNITSGHGGLLIVNEEEFIERSKVVWQKGTDKSKYDAGVQNYYQWVDIGSSFFPSELTAAYLYGQLQHLNEVTKKRLMLWNYYADKLIASGGFATPIIPEYSEHNGHIFYLSAASKNDRDKLLSVFKSVEIDVCSHYLSLSESEYVVNKSELSQAHKWQSCLFRLPLFYDLSYDQIDLVVDALYDVL